MAPAVPEDLADKVDRAAHREAEDLVRVRVAPLREALVDQAAIWIRRSKRS